MKKRKETQDYLVVIVGFVLIAVGGFMLTTRVEAKCTLGDILQFLGRFFSLAGAFITGKRVVSMKSTIRVEKKSRNK